MRKCLPEFYVSAGTKAGCLVFITVTVTSTGRKLVTLLNLEFKPIGRHPLSILDLRDTNADLQALEI